MPFLPPKKTRPKTNISYSKDAGNFYRNAPWIKLRNHKRDLNPLCELCEAKGLVVSMKIVDHIKPISEGGEALNLTNLQSLCDPCHRKKTAIEVNKRKA